MQPTTAELIAQGDALAAPHLPFTKRLPKLELHAHLTGSITPVTLQSIWEERRAQDPSFALAPPSEVLSPGMGHDILTFFPLFDSYIYTLLTTLHALRQATRAVLEAFAADGVVHLELRTGPRALTDSADPSDPTVPSSTPTSSSASAAEEQYVRAVLAEIHAWNTEAERQHGDGGMRAFLLLSIDRAKSDAARAERIVDLALRLRAEGLSANGPDGPSGPGALLVGIDLGGNPLKGSVRTFGSAFARARSTGLGLAVHFGEVSWEAHGLPSGAEGQREELDELLSWGPGRIGHAVHVPADIRERVLGMGVGVGMEICLSCNLLAGMVDARAGFAGHHARAWLRGGGRVVFCTDDVGVFGSGMGREWAIGMGAFGVGKAEVVGLCRGAVEVCFGGDGERARVRAVVDGFARGEGLGLGFGEIG